MYRQKKLEHKFGCKSSLRDTWQTLIFNKLDIGHDADSVDAALKGHEAINTDARVSCFVYMWGTHFTVCYTVSFIREFIGKLSIVMYYVYACMYHKSNLRTVLSCRDS